MFGSSKGVFIDELDMTDIEMCKLFEKKGVKKKKHKDSMQDFSYKTLMYMVYYNTLENRLEISRMISYSQEAKGVYRTFTAFYYEVGKLRGDDLSEILEFRNWLTDK